MKSKNFIRNDSDLEDDVEFKEFESDELIQRYETVYNRYVINLDEDINTPEKYRKIYDILRTVSEFDEIKIIINTAGGDLSSAVQLSSYILECPAKIIAEVHFAYSAGAMIALCCDEIIISDFSSMLIHSFSWDAIGKATEISDKAKFIDALNILLFQQIYKGFLNDTEIQDVIKGKELWLLASKIKQKLKKWVPAKKVKRESK